MPRRSYKKREAKKDLIYNSEKVGRLINYVMRKGKKSVAQSLVYAAFESIKKKNLDPLEVLDKAIDNVSPNFEVKPKRVGGASYLVPSETRLTRKLFLALKWIIEAAAARPNKEYQTFDRKLSAELLDAFNGQGQAIGKKVQVEKLAEANRAFAHFRW